MKKLKKILSTLLVFALTFSCLSFIPAFAKTAPDALSSTIYVTAPRVGATPSPSDISKSNSHIVLVDFLWAEKAPGESNYHLMQGSFKEGYQYRFYVQYGCTNGLTSDVEVFINDKQPSGISEDNYVYRTIYYDFGTLRSNNSNNSSGLSLVDILLFPVKVVIYPFAFMAGFFHGIFSGIFGV